MRRAIRSGFTMLEVLAVLLLISIGLTAAIGAFVYGLKLSSEAQGRSMAMATAISVARDRSPLLDPDLAPHWTSTTYDFNADTGTAEGRGPINGLFAVRNESTGANDIIAKQGGTVYLRSVQVDIDVFESLGGKLMASFSTRLVRQRGQP